MEQKHGTMVADDVQREADMTAEIARLELLEDGHDLPELADSMEEADARATASTYLRVMAGIEREHGANAAEHKNLVAYYKNRHDERQTQLGRRAGYMRDMLEKLFGFMTVAGKSKSLNLLGGRVGMRAQPDELVVESDDAVIEWALRLNNPTTAFVKVKHTLDRKALWAYMNAPDADYGLPPNVTHKARPDEFYATPAKD